MKKLTLLIICFYLAWTVPIVHAGGSPKTVTTNGSATISTTQVKIGTAAGSFPNAGSTHTDGLSLANSSDWAFGSNKFTVEGYVDFTAAGSKSFAFHAQDAANFLLFTVNTNGTMEVYSAINSNEFLLDVTSWGTISQNTWHHISFNRVSTANASTSWLFFVDGVAGTSYSLSLGSYSVTLTTPTGLFYIAAGTADSGAGITGYEDEVLVLNGTAARTANFTPPTTAYYGNSFANCVLLLHMDGTNGSTTFTDSENTVGVSTNARFFFMAFQ